MRAELGREDKRIVFVWKALTLADDEVLVYLYDGMVKLSADMMNIGGARGYWKSLISRGYTVIPAEARMMR